MAWNLWSSVSLSQVLGLKACALLGKNRQSLIGQVFLPLDFSLLLICVTVELFLCIYIYRYTTLQIKHGVLDVDFLSIILYILFSNLLFSSAACLRNLSMSEKILLNSYRDGPTRIYLHIFLVLLGLFPISHYFNDHPTHAVLGFSSALSTLAPLTLVWLT